MRIAPAIRLSPEQRRCWNLKPGGGLSRCGWRSALASCCLRLPANRTRKSRPSWPLRRKKFPPGASVFLALGVAGQKDALCDNYSTHKHPKVQRWLARHPRFHLHFTPRLTFIQGAAGAFHFFQDVGGSCGPDEWFSDFRCGGRCRCRWPG